MTGLHTVADVSCIGCGEQVGWTYVRMSIHAECPLWFDSAIHVALQLDLLVCVLAQLGAHQDSEQYKIGKYVLEKVYLMRGDAWNRPSAPRG